MSHRHKDIFSAEVDVPIVPMLDMAFQMLTFFVITYHPSALEGQFAVELAAAESRANPTSTIKPPDPSPSITKTKPLVTVIAKADYNGNLDNMVVQVRGAATEAFRDAKKPMLRALEKRLKEIKETEAKTALPEELNQAVLKGSPNLKWEDSMAVLDSMRNCILTRINEKGNHVPEPGEIRKYFPLFPNVQMDLHVGN